MVIMHLKIDLVNGRHSYEHRSLGTALSRRRYARNNKQTDRQTDGLAEVQKWKRN